MSRGAGDLPPGWRRVALSEVADHSLGKMLDHQKHTRGKRLPYLRNINVQWERIDTHDISEMFFEDDELDRFGLRAGDLLICEGGEPGRCAIWDGRVPQMQYQKALHRVRPSAELVSEYLQYQLKHDAGSGALDECFTGTTIKHFTGRSLARYELRLAPLPEQRRIVAKIEALTQKSRRAKEALDAIPPLLERFRQSVLASAFRGDLTKDWRAEHPEVEPAEELLKRIREERRKRWEEAELAKLKANGKTPKDDRWKEKYEEPAPVEAEGLPELPAGWCWATAAEIVEPGTDIVYGIVQPGPEIAGGVPYVRGMDIQDGRILEAQLHRTSAAIAKRYERASLRGGDVLLGIIRATKVAPVPATLDGANITQGTVRLRPSAVITTEFLAGFLDTPWAQEALHAMYRGIDMPGLNVRDVRRLPVALAPLAEQRVIAATLGHLETRQRTLRAAVAGAVTRHGVIDQAILAKAFRGELTNGDRT